MFRKYPHLSSSITIGHVTFRNRMFSAPMGGTDISIEGCIGPGSKAFYELRAKGGVAAVTISECMVHPQTDGSLAFHLDPSIWGTLQSATLAADAIRRHGAIPSLELSHSGQFAGTYMTDKKQKQELCQYGVTTSVRKDGTQIKELSEEQIQEIIASYGNVAATAKKAGFEMIMIHGGHGWLINQFLSPLFNKRTDRYGGTLENRARFACEVLDRVRQAVGPGFPIEFRMSGAEFAEGGYDLEEGIRIAKIIEHKADIIHVSAGTYQKTFGITHPSMFEEHGRNVYLAAEIKKHVSVPVATIGGLNDPQMMEEIIASEKADIVEMARALLADPELPRKILENRDDEIVHCLRCFTCMAKRGVTGTRRCTVNPLIGRELDGTEIIKSSDPKKVLVAGAGPGGLSAAITAAKRGHQVILCEKSDQVGGLLKGEQALSFKYDMYKLGITLERLAKKHNVEIRFNTEVTASYIAKEEPDAVIIAIGSSPNIPSIKGIHNKNVILVNDYYLHKEDVKDTVVVLGGGQAGCEIAIHLAQTGKHVSLIEMNHSLAPDSNIRHRPLLLEQISKHVSTFMEYKGMEITDTGVFCLDKNNEAQFVAGETVICALGQKPNKDLAEELRHTAPYTQIVGDANRVSTITNAIYQGYHTALDI